MQNVFRNKYWKQLAIDNEPGLLPLFIVSNNEKNTMFYNQANGHGLSFDPFKAILSPRPIGWISTIDEHGKPNLAPYSFFGAVSSRPHMVMFSSEGLKDSPRNAQITGEFAYNLSTLSLMNEMNRSSEGIASEINEFEIANLEMAPCQLISAPRVAASPAALECKVVSCEELLDLDGQRTNRYLVIGQVVGVHIDDRFLKEGRFDTAAAQPLARCGYKDYAVVKYVFELDRP